MEEFDREKALKKRAEIDFIRHNFVEDDEPMIDTFTKSTGDKQ
jgi:hypothetical protein